MSLREPETLDPKNCSQAHCCGLTQCQHLIYSYAASTDSCFRIPSNIFHDKTKLSAVTTFWNSPLRPQDLRSSRTFIRTYLQWPMAAPLYFEVNVDWVLQSLESWANSRWRLSTVGSLCLASPLRSDNSRITSLDSTRRYRPLQIHIAR
jgi:hypothetical protein